ncbi:hypothetical protein F383_35544 [Gossypium arboreum]|uniref:Uncharacterized protein n=1 Tax=Gossypium arboreum TaxID=29729 RepID=A0A0B0N6I3_GOSAR|nr:hypothetical protein F383_35544 [Gossypium arboreum]
MLMYGNVSLFFSYELTKLYSLLHFIFPCFIVSPSCLELEIVGDCITLSNCYFGYR